MIKPDDTQDLICLDFTNQNVSITINQAGNIVWVNVDGMCRLRVTKAKEIEIEDKRPE